MSVTVVGQKLAMPVYCSPTALQRLFHHQGERAVAAAAAKYGTMFGVSSLGTVSLEEARQLSNGPQVYQFYFHKDRGLNREMMARAKQAGIEVMMLTVDSVTGGNRERDKRTGFAIPFKLNLAGITSSRSNRSQNDKQPQRIDSCRGVKVGSETRRQGQQMAQPRPPAWSPVRLLSGGGKA